MHWLNAYDVQVPDTCSHTLSNIKNVSILFVSHVLTAHAHTFSFAEVELTASRVPQLFKQHKWTGARGILLVQRCGFPGHSTIAGRTPKTALAYVNMHKHLGILQEHQHTSQQTQDTNNVAHWCQWPKHFGFGHFSNP